MFTSDIQPVLAESSLPEKHLILNADGSYGGSVNESLYGKGAPKNGEYDVENSPYYTYNDFYNTKSTNEQDGLTILPNFKPYQQTKASSCGLCSMMSIFRHYGYDVDESWEVTLCEEYEQIANRQVKGVGTVYEFCDKLFKAKGLKTNTIHSGKEVTPAFETYEG